MSNVVISGRVLFVCSNHHDDDDGGGGGCGAQVAAI